MSEFIDLTNMQTKIQTEDEIMSSSGYLKIYDSGILRLEWNSNG